MKPQLILASQSPRRRELLKQVIADFDVDCADIDETPLPDENPETYVLRLAEAKARAVWTRRRDGIPVLGADTTVTIDGHVLGKPEDAREALRMLCRLNGRSHEVLTGIAVVTERGVESRLSTTTVKFGEISESALRAYAESGEPLDKAGGYGIQGRAGLFVEHLSGSFTGVVGLPLFETAQILAAAGIITL